MDSSPRGFAKPWLGVVVVARGRGRGLARAGAVASRTGYGGAATTRDGEVDGGSVPAHERPRDHVSGVLGFMGS